MSDGHSYPVAEFLEKAVAAAKARLHARVTADQLLIELLHDPTTRDALGDCGADLEVLEQELKAHLEANVSRSDGTAPLPDETLTRILRRIALGWEPKGTDIGGIDIVMSMLIEFRSFAAQAMRSHGVSFEALQEVAFAGEDAQAASDHPPLKPREPVPESDTGWLRGRSDPSVSEVRTWWFSGRDEPKVSIVEVRSVGANAVSFEVAVSRDGRLGVFEETTPWHVEGPTETIVALFEVIGDGEISANLYTEASGSRRLVSSFTGKWGMLADPGSRLQLIKSTMPTT